MQLVETRKFYVEGPNDASFCANFRRVLRESGDGDREYRRWTGFFMPVRRCADVDGSARSTCPRPWNNEVFVSAGICGGTRCPSSPAARQYPAAHAVLVAQMQKPPPCRAGVFGLGSLTITYFHTGIRTIIGVESFHGPVRDGKGWDRLAMVIRQRGLLCWLRSTTNLGRSSNFGLCVSHTRIRHVALDRGQCLRTAPIYKADLL